MPSPPERSCTSLAVLLVLTGALFAVFPATAQQVAPPQLHEVAAARQALRDDPNLGTERTMNTLRWHSSEDEEEETAAPRWLQWFAGLFRWIGQSGRFMVWVLAGLMAAAIIVYLLRLWRDRRPFDAAGPKLAPTHVRELDIRPESLPDDIGAAARALWDGGETRRALALLYRGMLSRLAHAHAAPVRESTTEGESVALARGCLPASGSDFAAALVRTWQFAVYGGRMPETQRVHELCAGFAPALDRAPAGSAA